MKLSIKACKTKSWFGNIFVLLPAWRRRLTNRKDREFKISRMRWQKGQLDLAHSVERSIAVLLTMKRRTGFYMETSIKGRLQVLSHHSSCMEYKRQILRNTKKFKDINPLTNCSLWPDEVAKG